MINVKKTLLDPLTDGKIHTPSPKNIAYLEKNGTYELFLRLANEQKKMLGTGTAKILAPAILGALGLGMAAMNYVNVRQTNDEYLEASERLINEAIAHFEVKVKGE